ncbi:hypothetical protein PSHT_15906 [Puccinia striiformis]|uniref:Uncharacterized protein n=2 Tax=Puccinia striiformis TaxID=27350 RepID=A0A2S4UCU9_9BASI|nr:hypothetical protein PSHT_15906 [Puccinia striiformis]
MFINAGTYLLNWMDEKASRHAGSMGMSSSNMATKFDMSGSVSKGRVPATNVCTKERMGEATPSAANSSQMADSSCTCGKGTCLEAFWKLNNSLLRQS